MVWKKAGKMLWKEWCAWFVDGSLVIRFQFLTEFKQSDERSIRAERIRRMKDVEWQFHYLFAFKAIADTVFFGEDFISVTKGDVEWPHIKPAILGAIMEHFMADQPVVEGAGGAAADTSDEFFDEADAKTVEVIKEVGNLTTLKASGSKDGRVTVSARIIVERTETNTNNPDHLDTDEDVRARAEQQFADLFGEVTVGS